MKFQSVKGTKDILPGDVEAWQWIEGIYRSTMRDFGFQEIRTPIFEETRLFSRGIGEETDIVGKEMYTFTDMGGTSLTLRPEMTASVVRAYIQNSLHAQAPLHKLFYIGPMFRQERPQAGRLRQFHQFGCEVIGSQEPACDAETIIVAAEFFHRLGLPFRLSLNSIGDASCRPAYRAALQAHLATVQDRLTAESRRRMETNPLRVLDSKAEQDIAATADAPGILDFLSDASREHFDVVQRLLTHAGIAFTIDQRLVRGLDYYTNTAFEFTATGLGSQNAICGGGRYDALIENLGGKPTPAVGFAAGVERLLMTLASLGRPEIRNELGVYIIGLDDASRDLAMTLALTLRRAGITTDLDLLKRSFKSQMRDANRLAARHTVIIGEEERRQGRVIVKRMSDGEQTAVAVDGLVTLLSAEQGGGGVPTH